MKRYEPDISYGYPYSDCAIMTPDAEGEYVGLEDAQKREDALRELLESLDAVLKELPHSLDLSDDQYLPDEGRRLLKAMQEAHALLHCPTP